MTFAKLFGTATLAAALSLVAVGPASARCHDSHRRHKVCKWERHHDHSEKVCHWARN